jgi:hypothetical protein
MGTSGYFPGNKVVWDFAFTFPKAYVFMAQYLDTVKDLLCITLITVQSNEM